MKSLLGMVIWICVGVGAISAVTAYFIPTDLENPSETYKSRDYDRAQDPELDNGKAGETGYLVLKSRRGPQGPA